jgi:hypothetical protein
MVAAEFTAIVLLRKCDARFEGMRSEVIARGAVLREGLGTPACALIRERHKNLQAGQAGA